ncbi:MAG: ComEC/Rec2 family competence protein [Pseudomonadota bacterium]
MTTHHRHDESLWGLLWLPVALMVGIGGYFELPFEPTWGQVLVVVLSLALAGLVIGFRSRSVGLLIVALAVGFYVSKGQTARTDTVLLDAPLSWVQLEGTIKEVEPRGKGYRLRITPTVPIATSRGDVRITVRHAPDSLHAGLVIRTRAMLFPPSGPSFPQAYDFRRYAFFAGLAAVGYSVAPIEIVSSSEHWQSWRHRARLILAERVDRAQTAASSVIAALLTGYRGQMAERDVEALRRSGLAHLLAISGLHVGMVTILCFVIVRYALLCIPGLVLRVSIKNIAMATALGGALAYTWFVGAPISAVRAVIMVACVAAGLFFGRRAISRRSVALAATLILLVTPVVMFEASFAMSFAAVLALVTGWEAWHKRFPGFFERGGIMRVGKYFLAVALSSLLASFAVVPFTVFYFNRWALLSLLGNLIAVPAMSFWVMPWGLVVLATGGSFAFATHMMSIGIDLILSVAHQVAAWSWAEIIVAALSREAMLAWLAMLAALLIARHMRATFLLAGLAVILTINAPTPVALLAPAGEVATVRLTDGRWLIAGNARAYAVSIWREKLAMPGVVSLDEAREGLIQGVVCTPNMCRVVLDNRKQAQVVILRDRPMFNPQDCPAATAPMILSLWPLPCAESETLITPDPLGSGGKMIVRVGDQLVVSTFSPQAGARPWQ